MTRGEVGRRGERKTRGLVSLSKQKPPYRGGNRRYENKINVSGTLKHTSKSVILTSITTNDYSVLSSFSGLLNTTYSLR